MRPGGWDFGLVFLRSLPTWGGIYEHCSHKGKSTGVGVGRVKNMPPNSQCAIRQVTKKSPVPCFLGGERGLRGSLVQST